MNEPAQNLNQVLLAAMEKHAEKICYKFKTGERYRNIHYRRFQTLTFRLVRFFQEQNISNGERVAIACTNGLEWMLAYVATLLSGGVVVPLPFTLTLDTFQFVLQDSGARILVLDDEERVQTFSAMIDSDRRPLPELETILTLNQLEGAYPATISIGTLLTESVALSPDERAAIHTSASATPPETLASIHYTAGETGRLKGAVFDHRRILKSLEHMAEWFPLNEDDVALTVLPWSFVHGLKAALHYFIAGITNVLSEPTEQAVSDNMAQTSPTITLSSPFFYERFYDSLMASIKEMPKASQEVFNWALAKGQEYHVAGPNVSPELREAYRRADVTFFSKFRGEIGGRMRLMVATGAPLSRHLAEFFNAIGLPVLNAYSLTEAGGFPAVSRPETNRPGSCGHVAPGFEIRIAEDSEVLVRSVTTMCEYWGWPAEMSEVVDDDGWLHTGDLGYFDDDGYLFLTGRKQPVMVLTTGRKVVPTPIEEALMASPFITQAIVIGEGWPYVSALLVPELVALAEHFQEDFGDNDDTVSSEPDADGLNWFWQQESEDSEPVTTRAHARVKMLLDKVVADINSGLGRWDQIRKYALLEQAGSKAADELADLMPDGRHLIVEKYASQIETLYPTIPQMNGKAITQVEVIPERMRELLEKESILDAWLADAGIEFLFNLARAKQIDVPSMVHICDTAAAIAQMESEEKPLSTAFVVGDPTRIGRILPPSEIQLLRGDHIRRMRHNLITLAPIVDGLVLGYMIDKHGYVRGIRRLRFEERQDSQDKLISADSANLLLGPQFRHRALISELCDAVVFFVPTGGRQVRVFANGQLVGRYSSGDWSPDTMHHVDERVIQLTEEKKYNPDLIRRVLRCAFQMSEENLGAIFTIGSADLILDQADAPEISHFAAITGVTIDELSNRELINFAKQDGATVIDAGGRFRGCMVLLRPGSGTKVEIGPGKGSRHSSAAKTSAETGCLAITVSQDGPITIYDSGRRVLSL